MEKDKKRAMGDYTCAARKLEALFNEKAYFEQARLVAANLTEVRKAFEEITAEEKEAGA
jgi:predicted ribosome quality control (RQC) complex YloA/Tae2 family protein